MLRLLDSSQVKSDKAHISEVILANFLEYIVVLMVNYGISNTTVLEIP